MVKGSGSSDNISSRWLFRVVEVAMKSKCLNCEHRHTNCHSTCDSYKSYQKQQAAIGQARHAETMINTYFAPRIIANADIARSGR